MGAIRRTELSGAPRNEPFKKTAFFASLAFPIWEWHIALKGQCQLAQSVGIPAQPGFGRHCDGHHVLRGNGLVPGGGPWGCAATDEMQVQLNRETERVLFQKFEALQAANDA